MARATRPFFILRSPPPSSVIPFQRVRAGQAAVVSAIAVLVRLAAFVPVNKVLAMRAVRWE